MNELCQMYQKSYDEGPYSKELMQHLESCTFCQNYRQSQETLRPILQSWRSPEFSEDFTLSVISRLAEEEAKKTSLWDRMREFLRSRIMIPLPAGVLTSLLLVASIGFNVYLMNQKSEYRESGTIVLVPSGETRSPAVAPAEFTNRSPYTKEWTGTGAFLLIPMMNLHHPPTVHEEQKDPQEQDVQDI